MNINNSLGEINNISKNYTIPDWYKIAIQTSIDGYLLLNTKGDILDANQAYCNMTGYNRNELLKMNLADLDIELVNDPNRLPVRIMESQLLNSLMTEKIHRRKDGKVIYIIMSFQYIDMSNGLFFCIHKDITEQKRLQQQLMESEELYRSLIKLGGRIGEAVTMTQNVNNVEGIQTFVSDEWIRITGYSKEELLGMSAFDFVKPGYEEFALEKYRQKIMGESEPNHYEIFIIKKNGHSIPIEITSAYTTYHGKAAVVAYIRDITTRKKLEAELAKYQNNLENIVRKKTAKLENEIEQRKQIELKLENQIEKKIDFTRALVHELKTPLTSLIPCSEALQSILKQKQEPQYSYIRNINISAKRLSRRVDELLDLAKSEAGVLKLNCHLFDPNNMIKETVDSINYSYINKDYSIIIDIPVKPPKIKADKERLSQVIYNLIDNAIKYSPSGSSILIKASEEDPWLRIEVSDSGIGISKKISNIYFNHINDSVEAPTTLAGLVWGCLFQNR